MYHAILITEDAKPGVMKSADTIEEAAKLGAEIIQTYIPYIVDPDVGDPEIELEETFGYCNPNYIEGVYIVQSENE